jgi:thiamine-phosphate pyrophosphorylase
LPNDPVDDDCGVTPSARPALRGLYALTPDSLDSSVLAAKVSDALAGGARLIQYRSKVADAALRRSQAELLRDLCTKWGVPLVINDDVRLAGELRAAGVHLGRDDASVAAARALLGPHALIGASCYADLERACAAAQAGADYVAFGSVFASRTKPLAPPAPLVLLGQARRRTGLPVAAIGGINLDNARQVIAAGADLLAVISDLFDAPDVAARAAAYARLFLEACAA